MLRKVMSEMPRHHDAASPNKGLWQTSEPEARFGSEREAFSRVSPLTLVSIVDVRTERHGRVPHLPARCRAGTREVRAQEQPLRIGGHEAARLLTESLQVALVVEAAVLQGLLREGDVAAAGAARTALEAAHCAETDTDESRRSLRTRGRWRVNAAHEGGLLIATSLAPCSRPVENWKLPLVSASAGGTRRGY